MYIQGSIPGTLGSTLRIRDSLRPKLRFTSPPPFPTFLPGDPGDDTQEELLCPQATELPAASTGKRK